MVTCRAARRRREFQISLQVRELLDLAGEYGGFRDVTLAVRDRRPPVIGVSRTRFMQAANREAPLPSLLLHHRIRVFPQFWTIALPL
jgi:hypothetical protein